MFPLLPQPAAPQPFTADQLQALTTLRVSYERQPDLFSERELARLHFVRWLYESGRMTS